MQDLQSLRYQLIQVIYKLPLDGLRLLAEFTAFVEAKFSGQHQTLSSEDTTGLVNAPSIEAGLGTEIAQIMADIGGVELELPERSLPRPAPNFMDS